MVFHGQVFLDIFERGRGGPTASSLALQLLAELVLEKGIFTYSTCFIKMKPSPCAGPTMECAWFPGSREDTNNAAYFVLLFHTPHD